MAVMNIHQKRRRREDAFIPPPMKHVVLLLLLRLHVITTIVLHLVLCSGGNVSFIPMIMGYWMRMMRMKKTMHVMLLLPATSM